MMRTSFVAELPHDRLDPGTHFPQAFYGGQSHTADISETAVFIGHLGSGRVAFARTFTPVMGAADRSHLVYVSSEGEEAAASARTVWPALADTWHSERVSNWVNTVAALDALSRSGLALMEITRATERAKKTRQFAILARDIEGFTIRARSEVILVGVLRNAFSIRSHLPNWDKFLHDVKSELIRRGRDVDRLLIGLTNAPR
jgi:hypothetical protein